jgi:adenosylcobinamide-GDP ribazoletransferase
MQPVRHFLLAVQFFTRIPITGRLAGWVGFSPAMLRASAAHFPGVGWLVGGLSAAVFYGVWLALPAQPAAAWVAAVACTVFSVLLTGAFHEDGLADLVDGLGGSMNRERALDIMKDSRVGTYGALALVLAVAAKVALLVLLAQAGGAWLAAVALFAAHVTSRLMPLFVIRTLAHVGDTPSPSPNRWLRASPRWVAGGVLWWALAMALAGWLLPGAPWRWRWWVRWWAWAGCGACCTAVCRVSPATAWVPRSR